MESTEGYTDVPLGSGVDTPSGPRPETAGVEPTASVPARSGRPRVREKPFPAELLIPTNQKPPLQRSWVHGFHSRDVIQIPTAMACDTCVLAAIKRKDPRNPLSCPEAKKHATCAILTRHQQSWVEGFVGEIRDTTGRDPTATDRARVEQTVRLRSRIFAIEVYLRAAGQVDLRTGELRAVMDRLNSIENALTRSLSELRSAMAEGRDARRGPAPRLDEYLASMIRGSALPPAPASDAQLATDGGKEIFTSEHSSNGEEKPA